MSAVKRNVSGVVFEPPPHFTKINQPESDENNKYGSMQS